MSKEETFKKALIEAANWHTLTHESEYIRLTVGEAKKAIIENIYNKYITKILHGKE